MGFVRSAILLLLLCPPLAVWAGPRNEADYEKAYGVLDIPDGAYVEGSFRQGGVQPDYHIDYSHPEIRRLLAYARRVKKDKGSFWEKVERLQAYVRGRHLVDGDYEAPSYVDLNKRTLRKGANVSLGEYSACRAGVCRENALFLHLALKEAGIPNYHAYARVRQFDLRYDFDVTENHGFVVAEHNGKKWVLDSYNYNFNGFLLKDLMSVEGITEKSIKAPVAVESATSRRILHFNDFPKVWVPKSAGKPKALKITNPFPRGESRSCQHLYRDFTGY